MGGWKDGRMEGGESRVKDCLQQSKIYLWLIGSVFVNLTSIFLAMFGHIVTSISSPSGSRAFAKTGKLLGKGLLTAIKNCIFCSEIKFEI